MPSRQRSNEVEVGAVAISDLDAVRPLREGEALELGALLASMDPWKTLGFGAGALQRYLTRSDPALDRLVLISPKGLAGILCVRYPWLRGPFVELLAVVPGEQGRGLGRRVLSWVESESRWEGQNVWVTVSGFNESARGFYERSGYREVATLPRLVGAEGEEILLRKEVAARLTPAPRP